MVLLGSVRIVLIVGAAVLFAILTRRLARRPLRGYPFILGGISLVTVNMVVGAMYHSGLVPEQLRESLLPLIGPVTGLVAQPVGLAILLFGVYQLVQSLQPHLDARYSSLVEHALVGVYLVQDGKFVFVNPKFAEISGYTRKELVGMRVLDLVAPQDRKIVEENLRARVSGEKSYLNYQARAIRKNGELITVEVYGSRLMYDGRPAIHGTLLDVTQRIKAEEAVRASQMRFDALTRSTYDLISETAPDGRLLFISENVKDVLGYTSAELIGSNIFDLVCPEDLPAARKEFQRAFTTTSSGRTLSRYRHKNGEWRWLECAGQFYQTEDGETRGIVVSRDVTTRKRMDEEMLKASKLESVGVLAGGIAHDFNNILTVVLGNVSLAKTLASEKSELQQILADAEKACLKAKDLTQQFLTFSKGGEPVKEIVPIAGVVRESVDFALRGSNIKCEFRLPEDLWPVELDERQFGQVLHNLIINADQAMPEGGTVWVEGENLVATNNQPLPAGSDKYVKLTIRDQGIGIPEEHLHKIFDPYFTTKQKGSGLGLATAYSIVKNHGGLLTVESRLGEGTAFYIYLPAFPERTPREVRRSNHQKQTIAGTAQGRVLLMDDEPAIRSSVRRMLQRIGYEVVVAENGAEAIRCYSEAVEAGQPFDAVLLDLTIPGGMGGKETIQRLREVDRDVRAIVSSGYSNDPIMAEFENYGFKGVIAKPYEFDTLRRVLTQVTASA